MSLESVALFYFRSFILSFVFCFIQSLSWGERGVEL